MSALKFIIITILVILWDNVFDLKHMYTYALMIHPMCLLCNSSYLRICDLPASVYTRIYVRTYLCIYMHVIHMNVTCDMCVYCHWRNIKHQKRLVRKFNNLTIIHQTFPLSNTHTVQRETLAAGKFGEFDAKLILAE